MRLISLILPDYPLFNKGKPLTKGLFLIKFSLYIEKASGKPQVLPGSPKDFSGSPDLSVRGKLWLYGYGILSSLLPGCS
jgi:hypothetical protein